jgi:dihydroflavonol-4-reductase
MKPVLVTGASGFLGWHVARVALERGCAVRALVRPGSRVEELPVETVTGDLRDPASLARAAGGCGVVFHVAADYRLWARNPRELYDSNVEGTRNLLVAARTAGVERVIYTSTVGAIGIPREGLGDEATPVSLKDMAGRLQALQIPRRTGGAGVCLRRPGYRDCQPDRADGRSRFQTYAYRPDRPRLSERRFAGLHRYGSQRGGCARRRRGPLAGLERGRSGERYILGSQNLTLAEILSQLAAISHRTPPRLRLPYFLAWCAGASSTAWASLTGSPPHISLESVRLARSKVWVSHAKATRELGYQPRPAAQALARAVEWFTRRQGQV